jgi:hypothetical protein
MARSLTQWWRDVRGKNRVEDRFYSMTPETQLKNLEAGLKELAPAVRGKQYMLLENYATAYFKQHLGLSEVDSRVQAFQMQRDRLYDKIALMNEGEIARQKVMEMGGPPTKYTMQNAIAESNQIRMKQARELSKNNTLAKTIEQPNQHRQTKEKKQEMSQTMGMSW